MRSNFHLNVYHTLKYIQCKNPDAATIQMMLLLLLLLMLMVMLMLMLMLMLKNLPLFDELRSSHPVIYGSLNVLRILS